MSLNNILGRPVDVPEVGSVFPVKVKDWDIFEKNVNILMLSKKSLPLEIENDDITLLDRIVFGLKDESVINSICTIFNLVFNTKGFAITGTPESYFLSDSENIFIEPLLYDDIRRIILHQNLILEPKIYKDKRMQEWAQKALEVRNKDAANITLEDMITTVAVISGKHYWDIEEYTMYQLQSEFRRINKIKHYDTTSIMFANPYATDIKLDHFAEYLDLYADPYKDLFKKKEKLNITKALGE